MSDEEIWNLYTDRLNRLRADLYVQPHDPEAGLQVRARGRRRRPGSSAE